MAKFLPLKKRSTPHVNLDFDRFSSGVQGELAVFKGSKSGEHKFNQWLMNKMLRKLLFLKHELKRHRKCAGNKRKKQSMFRQVMV